MAQLHPEMIMSLLEVVFHIDSDIRRFIKEVIELIRKVLMRLPAEDKEAVLKVDVINRLSTLSPSF